MFKAILARFKQGYKTGKFPLKGEPKLPDNFMGRPEIAAEIPIPLFVHRPLENGSDPQWADPVDAYG